MPTFVKKFEEKEYALVPFEVIIATPTATTTSCDLEAAVGTYVSTNHGSVDPRNIKVYDPSVMTTTEIYEVFGKEWYPLIAWLMAEYVKNRGQQIRIITITEE